MAVTGTTFSAKGGTASTAELRALGAQFSTAIASAGMVKTTDTGQTDWTTITWVTGAQTWGYEVWRFADPLQATKPVFVKLVYSQPASPLMLNITAQVGTATDGAGNLTSMAGTGVSVTTARVICGVGTAANIATVSPWYVYGDGSALVIASTPERINATTSGYGGLFFLERARHTDGTPLGDGLLCFWASATATSSSAQVVMLHTLYPQPGAVSQVGWFPDPGPGTLPASGVVGADMFTVPWFTGLTPRLGAPSTMIIGFYRADMPTGNAFTCTHYGASRTFVAIQLPATYSLAMAPAGGTTFSPAIRTT